MQLPQQRELDEDLHGRPWISLVYLAFVFLPLVFWPNHPASAVYATLAAVAVFLPLYFGFFRSGERVRTWLAFAVAGLGYALIPFNPGGNTFLIYAFALVATVFAARTAIVISALMLAAMALEFFWVMPTPELALAYTLLVALIGTMVVAGILFSRLRWRRNADLRLSQEEVRRLAAMAERERIGRDLHDLLGHTLSVIVLKSELAGKLLDRDANAARAQIGEVESVARQALAQVREAVAGIRSTGLQAELAAARLALLSADVHLDQRLPSVAMDEKTENVMAMAVREAVTNILRHAGARRVEVELREDGDRVMLSIADDGRGGIVRHGNGLTGMKERLASVRGTLDVDSAVGAGTRLTLCAPRPSQGVDA